MNQKSASVLDYARPGLDGAVWSPDVTLLPEHKDQIVEYVMSNLISAGYQSPQYWMKFIKIVGSMTTYQYLPTSDLDVHIEVDLPAYIKHENPLLSEQEAHDTLDAIRKEMNKEAPLLGDTQHPVEVFFETPLVNKNGLLRSGAYDVLNDVWLEPPVVISQDYDLEESQPVFIQLAEELAGDLDESFGKIKRNISRIEELYDVIKVWPQDKKDLFAQKIEKKMETINQELSKMLQMRDQIVLDRRNYSPESQQEISFKYLQRFGYMIMLTKLKELVKDDGKVTEDELPQVKKILDKEAADSKYLHGYCAEYAVALSEKLGKPLGVIRGHFADDEDVDDAYQDAHAFVFISDTVGMDAKGERPIQDMINETVWVEKPTEIDAVKADLENLEFSFGTIDRDIVEEAKATISKQAAKSPKVTPIETMTISGNTVQLIADSAILDEYLKAMKLSIENPESWDFDAARAAAHDAVLENTLAITDFKGEDPYLFASNVRDAISRFAEEMFNEKYGSLKIKAEFLPSIGVHAPNNDWQSDSDLVTPQNVDPVSDEETYNNPAAEKPRKGIWRSLIDWFINREDKEASSWNYAERAAWIAPDGQVYPVSHSHVDWYLANKKMLKDKYKFSLTDKEEQSSDPVDWLIQNDWIRLAFATQNSREVGVQVSDIHSLPSFFEDTIWQFNPKKLYIEDASGNDVTLNEQQLHRGIQKSLQRYRTQKASNLKRSDQSGYWIDPNGKVIQLRPNQEHAKVIKQYGLEFPEAIINNNWTRIRMDGDVAYIEVKDIRNVPPFIEDFIVEHPVRNVLIEEPYHGAYVEVNPNDMLESNLQEAINYELRRSKAASFQLQYWLDSNGQEYEGDALKEENVQADKLIRGGWVQVLVPSDRQGVVLVVDELEFIPDFVNGFLAKTVRNGDPVTVKDTKGSTVTLRYPFKNIRGLIKKYLYAPEQEKAAALGSQSIWISPDGKEHQAQYSHADWAFDNADFLSSNYGIHLVVPETFDDLDDSEVARYHADILDAMLAADWVRIFIYGSQINFQIADMQNPPKHAEDFFDNHAHAFETILVADGISGDSVEILKPDLGFARGIAHALRTQNQLAASKVASLIRGWFDPNGKFYPVKFTHYDWMLDNSSLLQQEFGFEVDELLQDLGDDPWGVIDSLIDTGWVRIGDIFNATDMGIHVPNLNEIPPYVIDYLVQNVPEQATIWIEDTDNNGVEVTKADLLEGQDAVNSAIKRRHTFDKSKAASLTTIADLANVILDLLKQTGGATYNLSKGNLAGTKNYAVSIYLNNTQIFDKEPSVEEINSYIQKNQSLLKDANNSLGAWHDTSSGKYYFDVVVTTPDREKAIELGKQHNQKAIFDLEKFEEIPTGGTGEVQSKQAASDQEYWINPQGQVFDAPEGHERWILMNLGSADLPASYFDIDGDIEETDVDELREIRRDMFQQGWVRIGTPRSIGVIQLFVELESLSKIPSFVDDFLAEHFDPKSQKIVVVADQNERSVDVTNPFPTLQKAIQKELRRPRVHADKESGFYGPEDGHPKEYYNQETNDQNLGNPNQRFMGRPKGKHKNNMDVVIQWLFEKDDAVEKKAFTINGFWVAPDGKAFDVRSSGSHTHGDWVMKNANILAKYGIKDAKKRDYFEVATEMLQKGWARVGDSARNKYATIGVEVNDIKNIPSGVDNVLAGFLQDGDVIIVADLSDNWIETTYPFKSLQNAVNKARMGRRGSAYTQQQMEEIYVEQHEMNDNSQGVGGFVTDEVTRSTTDYPMPKDIEPVRVFLDKLDKTKTPPIPSYEVSWYISTPKE